MGVTQDVDEEMLKYPIGKFLPDESHSDHKRKSYMKELGLIVPSLEEVVKHLDRIQLQAPYRPGGWSLQQVIHHMADNDMNAYIRLKRALTENEPMASSYEQDLWAGLHDYKETPIQVSVQLMRSIHTRMIHLLEGLDQGMFSRRFSTHVLGVITVDTAIQRFIWHNKHHIAQVRAGSQRMLLEKERKTDL
jgi:hypothetical protein